LRLVNAFGLAGHAGADPKCEGDKTGRWHFICSFVPTPKTSAARVQFG
jgi:hypothetical protein